MSVSIPQPFRTRIEGTTHTAIDGPIGPVTVAGIPSDFDLDINNLPVIHAAIDSIPVIHLSLDHIPKIQLGVDPVELRLTEFPSIRGHLPADFSVGLSVLGMDLAAIRLCGEAQIITEPYEPNPCEVCAPLPQRKPPKPAEPLGPAGRVAAKKSKKAKRTKAKG